MRTLLSAGIALAFLLTACTSDAPDRAEDATVYDVQGKIVEVVDSHTLIVDHAPIPGYMAAMKMPFSAKDAQELVGLEPGDAIGFNYTVDEEYTWISGVETLSSLEAADLDLASYQPERFEPSAESVFLVDAPWTTHRGENITLADFHGQPVLMSMVFTRCAYACPMLVSDMRKIAAELPDELQRELQLVLVTIDPKRDTPEVLASYADAHRMSDRWTLLHGREADIRTLAALQGIRYKEGSDGQFSHSNMITLLNAEGEIVEQQTGLNVAPERMAAAVQSIAFANK